MTQARLMPTHAYFKIHDNTIKWPCPGLTSKRFTEKVGPSLQKSYIWPQFISKAVLKELWKSLSPPASEESIVQKWYGIIYESEYLLWSDEKMKKLKRSCHTSL